jgi:hypothetical protein
MKYLLVLSLFVISGAFAGDYKFKGIASDKEGVHFWGIRYDLNGVDLKIEGTQEQAKAICQRFVKNFSYVKWLKDTNMDSPTVIQLENDTPKIINNDHILKLVICVNK